MVKITHDSKVYYINDDHFFSSDHVQITPRYLLHMSEFVVDVDTNNFDKCRGSLVDVMDAYVTRINR